MKPFKKFAQIFKVDAARREVHGLISAEEPDASGECMCVWPEFDWLAHYLG